MIDQDFRESAWDCVSCDKTATFSTNESKWINKLLKLAKEYPDDVKIDEMPEENWGTLLVHLPKKWCKISPPRKVNMTDEEKAIRADRMRKVAQKKKENKNSD